MTMLAPQFEDDPELPGQDPDAEVVPFELHTFDCFEYNAECICEIRSGQTTTR